ncbi:energy-coupling factor transporter transmembrane component T [Pseudogracilibacillus auburnensis]|uniref:energy-coupling factor transporter transmembrane component T n=1 Tax=Pseudogracilibacillus auburnensis TaxID=1494959 RepID=UPI001A96613B|nr:energy-coupling factor transporter transmembrane component T [Pseudogracilibacillus auburnensis]MBO1005549.1 energy-coupling factor transporter transmembrane protein EcfT [Pseudogracilibacillus auburnensis]
MKSMANFHPFVLFMYYSAIICVTMFMMHPIILAFSFVGSLTLFAFLIPFRQLMKDVGFYLFFFLLIAITNPIFVHKGETILFFLNDNPVTFEAIIYGIFISTMLVAVIFWSKSYNLFMTSDKFIYLFGKTLPKLSLVLSMALRFIPLFIHQIRKVHQTQKTLGLYTSTSITDRLVSGIRIFNSMIMWSLENAMLQADGMKAKGYGLKGRTNFSLFRWHVKDSVMLILIILLLGILLFLHGMNHFTFNYYPALTKITLSWESSCQFFIVLVFMMLPTLMEIKENLHWKYLKLKMSHSSIQNSMNQF